MQKSYKKNNDLVQVVERSLAEKETNPNTKYMQFEEIIKALAKIDDIHNRLMVLQQDFASFSKQLVSPTLSVKDASKLTGISAYTIKQALRKGYFTGIVVNPQARSFGVRYAIDRASLLAWFEGDYQPREGVEL